MSQSDDLLNVQAPCADVKSFVPDAAPVREPAQRTLAAIGDVGVAVSETLARSRPARRYSWAATFAFTLAVYALALAAISLAGGRDGRGLWLLLPLMPTMAALAAFRAYQVWRFRAEERQEKLHACRNTLESVAFECANAANAIRANLLGMESATEDALRDAHLQEIHLAARRITAVVRRADGPAARTK
jgi:hypothetical protein